MKKILPTLALTACALFAAAPSAQATLIEYDVQQSGNTWLYTYSITNDTLSESLDEFTIWFDRGQYSNLSVVATPDGWDGFVAQPDPNLPDDGLFDVLASIGFGIAPGATLSGFVIAFEFLLSGEPGAQTYDVLRPDPFEVIGSGVTVRRASVPVPEPGAFALLALGLLASGLASRKNAAKHVTA